MGRGHNRGSRGGIFCLLLAGVVMKCDDCGSVFPPGDWRDNTRCPHCGRREPENVKLAVAECLRIIGQDPIRYKIIGRFNMTTADIETLSEWEIEYLK